MDVQSNALTTAASNQPARRTPVPAGRLAVLGLVVVALLLLWVISIAKPLVAFLMAVALATSWCLWLEKHPEPRAGHDTRPSESVRR
jgi:Flp pilus assembly protein TadB